MKAVVFREARRPVQVEDMPTPSVGDTDVLVRIKAAGICHSDLHTLHGLYPVAKVPMVLGHEGAGIVEKIGKRVTNVSEGDRVTVDYVLSCGNCEYCNADRNNLCNDAKYYGWNFDGTWAEYMLVQASNVFRLPKNVSFAEGALAGCAVVTGYHTMKISGIKAGDSVAIIGLGGVGTQLLQWCKIYGATRIIGVDIDDDKLQLASKLGATATVNARHEDPESAVKKLTDGKGVDVAFEAIGRRETVEKMILTVKKGGKAVIVGMCFDKISVTPVYDLMAKEIEIRNPTDHTKSEVEEVLGFLGKEKYDLSRSITQRIPIEKATQGLQALEKTGKQVRIVIEP